MVLIHAPRMFYSIAKGLIRRRGNPEASLSGMGPHHPHIYYGRAGLLDVDYLGHMNNAQYLSHAELARWDMTAFNGLLSTLHSHGVHFVVSGTCIRYRRQIRPVLRKFQIDSYVAGMDSENIWIYQKFRYPIEGNDRVRCQVLVQAAAIKGRQVLDPCLFFKETVGLDAQLVDSLTLPNVAEATVEGMLEHYDALEHAMRMEASDDDDRRREE